MRFKPYAMAALLAALMMTDAAPAQDPEHVEYVEEHTRPRIQHVELVEASFIDLRDGSALDAEHVDYIERDDGVNARRLVPPVRRAPRNTKRVTESPEHEDYIETLVGSDRRASHSIIWFDDPDPAPDDSMEVLPPPVTELPEGMMFIEGDLVVPEDAGAVSATYIVSRLWSRGTVPYQFDDNVSAGNQTLMLDAMRNWEAIGNLDFRPATELDLHFLYIQNASFNASEDIGLAGGRHDIWISSWNSFGTIMHELGHAILYYHEQSRIDRTDYIQVNSSNISQTQCPGDGTCDHNFKLRISFDREYGPYDFDSVMHYGQCDFSKCNDSPPTCTSVGCGCAVNETTCRTITVLPPNESWQDTIGQRDHLSYFDQKVMTMSYPESDYVFLDENNFDIFDNFGTFNDPYWEWPTALEAVPEGGTIWILNSGVYAGPGIINKRVSLRAPVGTLLGS